MTIRSILRYPDPRLRQQTVAITQFDAALAALAVDLQETMRAAPGIGITGPHIGAMQRLVVLELEGPASTRIYVNPIITWQSTETARHVEGSVSMPGISEKVERPARIHLTYQDLNGQNHAEEADGFLAVCLQHEIDQLDGVFWIFRLSRLKRDRLMKRFERQRSG